LCLNNTILTFAAVVHKPITNASGLVNTFVLIAKMY